MKALPDGTIDILVAGANIALSEFLPLVFSTFSTSRNETLLYSAASIEPVSVRCILHRMKVIGTTEAAKRLGVNPSRVRALIVGKGLKAHKVGREYAFNRSDLMAVKKRTPGASEVTEGHQTQS